VEPAPQVTPIVESVSGTQTTPEPTPVPPKSADAAIPNLPANQPVPARAPAKAEKAESKRTPLKGAPLRTAKNMDQSLEVPTATSVRTIPMKLVIDQRTMMNTHLKRTTGGKVSYTHIIAYAMVQAIKAIPAMNVAYEVVDGKPTLIEHGSINLGLAIDMAKPDGTRQLLVPNVKSAETMDFLSFWQAYEALVKKAR